METLKVNGNTIRIKDGLFCASDASAAGNCEASLFTNNQSEFYSEYNRVQDKEKVKIGGINYYPKEFFRLAYEAGIGLHRKSKKETMKAVYEAILNYDVKPSYNMLSVDDIDFGSIEEKPQTESKDHFESVMQNSFSKTFIEELEIGRRLYEDRQDIEIVRQITELIMLVKRYYNTNLVKK